MEVCNKHTFSNCLIAHEKKNEEKYEKMRRLKMRYKNNDSKNNTKLQWLLKIAEVVQTLQHPTI